MQFFLQIFMFPSWSNTEISKEEERLGEEQQQKGFMKDLALIPRRGEQGGPDA